MAGLSLMIEAEFGGGKEGPGELAEGGWFIRGLVFQVVVGGAAFGIGWGAGMDGPVELVDHCSGVVELGEAGEEIVAGGLEPGVDGVAVAEEEGLVDGGLKLLAGQAAVLADEFGEGGAKLGEEL